MIKNGKSEYFQHNFNLTENQTKSAVNAIQSQKPIVLKLKANTFINGVVPLPLTKTDVKHVIDNTDFIYNLSRKKLKLYKAKDDNVHEGGAFPFILPLFYLARLLTAGATAGTTKYC
jgi:hypothetical protein